MNYDIFFIVDSGIGNALETMYAVEYCIANNKKTGIHMGEISKSFQDYLLECYGSDVVVFSLENIKTNYLIHSFTSRQKYDIQYDNYFYVQADIHSTKYKSETELYLEIVKALYPSNYESKILTKLIEDYSQRIQDLKIENKTIIFPGCTIDNAVKRWPFFPELINILGEENIILIASNDDFNFNYSYFYPKYITKIIPQFMLNLIYTWRFFKKIGLLKKHAHSPELQNKKYAYIQTFTWKELNAIFRRCKNFVGNDGGLAHVAAVAGCKGLMIFGPTSVEKNKALNDKMKPLNLQFNCQPCQYNILGISMMKYFINCPFQVRCLYEIKPEIVLEELKKI